MNAPEHPDEARRLETLRQYQILDTPPERGFDDITELAAQSLRMPIAFVSFIDADRQWFKSIQGLETRETPRGVALCAHTILRSETGLEVTDARADPLFRDNPMVAGVPHVRFYAAVPLLSPDGLAMGTLGVIDRVPRQLGSAQWQVLRVLARQVQAQLELRRQARALQDKTQVRAASEARLRAGYEALLEQLREAAREKSRLLRTAQEASEALAAALASEQASGRALQESEARFRGLWTSAQDTVLILDEHSTITYTNDAAARSFGWTPAELIGRDVAVLQPERLRSAHHHGMLRYLNTGERRVDWRSTETIAQHRDGREIAVEVSFSEFSIDGRRMFAGFLRDIDQRKKAEAERARLADFLEHSVNEVLVLEPATLRLQYANGAARRNLALSQSELEQRTVTDITPEEDRADLVERLQAVREDDDARVTFKTRHLRAGAEPYMALVNAQRVGPAHDRVLLLTGLDITELDTAERARESLQRQLRQVQQLQSLGTLAGGIAHDFNNIVGSMLGNVALARQDLPEAHPARVSVEQIERAALRGRALVAQILAFSRQQPPVLAVQPLRPVLESTARLLQASLPAGVQLRLALPDEELHARADTVQLERVLMNLATNAVHACAERGGRIEIGLARRAAQVCLWVEDNGVGIDGAIRERLFEPFFTTKPVGQGTGLGLAVVHGIVSAHGGTITVHSAPGEGARFEICLPLAPAPAPVAAPAPAPTTPEAIARVQAETWAGGGAGASPAQGASAAHASPGAPARAPEPSATRLEVLCLDDDEVMLLMVERLLERAGYRVTTAQGPQAALHALAGRDTAPACVVTDYSMPGLTGLEFARQLHRERPEVPVVVLSGDVSDAVRREALAHGITELVPKQHAVEALPAAVARACARSAAR